MMIKDADIKEYFYIENIDAPDIEKETLNMIGIQEGIVVEVIGEGYLKGSLIVKKGDGLVIQLNPYFTSKINGSVLKQKRLVK